MRRIILLGESAHLVTLAHVQCCVVVVGKRIFVLSAVLRAVLSVILIRNISIITISKRLDDLQMRRTALKRKI